MKLRSIATIVTSLCCAVPAAAAAQTSVYGHPQAAERVTDRLHVMRQPDRVWSAVVGNVAIIEQSDGVVLFDTGASLADGKRVVSQVKALTRKPVKAVVLSHWHGDHPMGLPAILEQWPRVRIIATTPTAAGLREIMSKNVGLLRPDPALDAAKYQRAIATAERSEESARNPELSLKERQEFAIEAHYLRARASEGRGSYIVLPTEIVSDRLTLRDRVAPIELQFLGRANTDGDLVAWLPRQKAVIAGDVVVAPIPFGFNSYPSDWIDVLKKLKALNFSYLVPGHGKVQKDQVYLDQLIGALGDVRTQVRDLAAQGLTPEEVQSRVAHDNQTRIFTNGDPWITRLFKNYWLDPITSSAYREAKGIPIVPGG
jgi:glyoxylase-like metal-dependent hydrolase (beta-lactamase superfamily II)